MPAITFLVRRGACLAACVALLTTAVRGASVLPPSETPNGWSLDQMASAVSMFSVTGNNLDHYPETPFQILYRQGPLTDPTGANTFHVQPDTPLYVKFFFIDNAPPVIGDWPADKAAAAGYVFGPTQLGAHDFEIELDGTAYSINDPGYIGGPVATPEATTGGTHMIQIGAFISPLDVGTHQITARGVVGGDAFVAAAGGPFAATIDYTVVVVPEPSSLGLSAGSLLVLGAIRRKLA